MTCGAPSAPAVARCPTRCASRKRRASSLQIAIARLPACELGLRLRDDLAVAPFVPRREVEHLEAAHSGRACERAGLRRGQMIAPGGLLEVFLQERCLAEKDVGLHGEARDLGD